jgi:hypothetical protein
MITDRAIDSETLDVSSRVDQTSSGSSWGSPVCVYGGSAGSCRRLTVKRGIRGLSGMAHVDCVGDAIFWSSWKAPCS